MNIEVKEDQIRHIIVEAARQLFKKHGYNKIVMEDIAKAVKKGRSTLYIYFKNKEEIFNAILQEEANDYFLELESILPAYTTATEKLKMYCYVKFSFIQNKVNECLVLTNELLQQPDIMNKVHELFKSREAGILEHIISLGIAHQEFSPLPPQQIQLLSNILLSALSGIIDDFCLKNPTCDLEPVKDRVEDLLLKALK